MPTSPIDLSSIGIDLSSRFIQSSVVAASPSANSETTICTLTLPSNLFVVTGVFLLGFAAFTVGTSGTACTLQIKQTSTGGAAKGTTGATTGGIAAGNLIDMNISGFDAAPAGSQVYVLDLTVTGGAAASTVSACTLMAIVV
jgi:hypothetical protein